MAQNTLEKWIAGAGATMLFVLAGAEREEILMLPAIGAQAAGFLLWGRAWATSVITPPAAPPAMEPPPPVVQLAQMQEVLLSLQDEVGRLREDREFYRELYSGASDRPRAIRERFDS